MMASSVGSLTTYFFLFFVLCNIYGVLGSERENIAKLENIAYRNSETQYALTRMQQHEQQVASERESWHNATGLRSKAHALRALNAYTDFNDALNKMQVEFFELWLGTWPSTIDWTGAVMGTYVSAALSTISKSFKYKFAGDSFLSTENAVNKYFSHLTAYYFRENAFAIRLQAYDDMLWVVLGWLEGIKSINMHNDLHNTYSPAVHRSDKWHGMQFLKAFSHRARIFYDITSAAWDTSLCDGGLTWNPSLNPYKNTITNTLFISASVNMYLYHPGDRNRCPFTMNQNANGRMCEDDDDENLPHTKPHDPAYLRYAVNAYDWLVNVDLLNKDGLYVDGYHVHNYGKNGSIGTGRCDEREEMVYTYNQGVILSGLRSLWEATGNLTYLTDGHRLVRNVIRATGWNETDLTANYNDETTSRGTLGVNGILTEFCDPRGTCNQDGQTFKGIFFHHLTMFCTPLPTRNPLIPGLTHLATQDDETLHKNSCQGYVPWVARNAKAALETRGSSGIFGGWWGAGRAEGKRMEDVLPELPKGATDYRNNDTFIGARRDGRVYHGQVRIDETRDVNDRGRGRTVETQGGGLSVLRALYELVTMYNEI